MNWAPENVKKITPSHIYNSAHKHNQMQMSVFLPDLDKTPAIKTTIRVKNFVTKLDKLSLNKLMIQAEETVSQPQESQLTPNDLGIEEEETVGQLPCSQPTQEDEISPGIFAGSSTTLPLHSSTNVGQFMVKEPSTFRPPLQKHKTSTMRDSQIH